MVAYPFTNISISAPRPPDAAYPTEVKTIGDHLRVRRLEMGLIQSEVAQRIGVTVSTIWNWESGRCEPDIRMWAGVIRFLDGYPFPTETPAEQLIAYRRQNGLSQEELAVQLGVDPATLGRWERGGEVLRRLDRKAVSGMN